MHRPPHDLTIAVHLVIQRAVMTLLRSSLSTVLVLLFCTFIWGSVFPVSHLQLQHMTSMSLARCRFIISVAGLGCDCLWRHQGWPRLDYPAVEKQHVR